MRLIHCTTLKVKEFSEGSIPRYVILSHTWLKEDEVTFQEINSVAHDELAKTKPASFKKIQQFCKEVSERQSSIEYAWIDTCCIDKTSSAELSEAINSMFKWYKESFRCYVYMSDVFGTDLEDESTEAEYCASKWWTRGWTLQELIAPNDQMVFYNAHWEIIGTKSWFRELIARITGIPLRVLTGEMDVYRCSVGHRMSWASKRVTTRSEDMAYSLIGLFNVNMPLLYGEGNKAFVRLQEEILKETSDQTIFAWSDKKSTKMLSPYGDRVELRQLSGVLATHPKHFLNSAKFYPAPAPAVADMARLEMVSTNQGLKLWMPILRRRDSLLGIISVTTPISARQAQSLARSHGANSVLFLLGILLFPEPGSGGRLMRIADTDPVVVDAKDVESPEASLQTTYLLKTNWAQRSYRLQYLDITRPNSGASFTVVNCHYAPLPIHKSTIFEAHHSGGSSWRYWNPGSEGQTMFMLTIEMRSEHKFTVVLLLGNVAHTAQHRTSEILCAISRGHVQENDRVQRFLECINGANVLSLEQIVEVTSSSRMSISCKHLNHLHTNLVVRESFVVQ